MANYFIPTITTLMDGRECNIDLYSYRFNQRKVILNGEVNAEMADKIIAELGYLAEKSNEDITLYINSPGGNVSDGMAIYDFMKYGITCDIRTVAIGMAASMGAFLLAGGTKGKRYASPNSEIMIHQPLGGISGQATDIRLVAEHITQLKHKLATILADEADKTAESLIEDMERDYWMTANECLEYGLIDHVGYPE